MTIDQYITNAIQFAIKDPSISGYETTISLLDKEYPNYQDLPRMYENLSACLGNLALLIKCDDYALSLKSYNLLKRSVEVNKKPTPEWCGLGASDVT